MSLILFSLNKRLQYFLIFTAVNCSLFLHNIYASIIWYSHIVYTKVSILDRTMSIYFAQIKRWSLSSDWTGDWAGTKPQAGDDVTIPSSWWMIYDDDMVGYGTVSQFLCLCESVKEKVNVECFSSSLVK